MTVRQYWNTQHTYYDTPQIGDPKMVKMLDDWLIKVNQRELNKVAKAAKKHKPDENINTI